MIATCTVCGRKKPEKTCPRCGRSMCPSCLRDHHACAERAPCPACSAAVAFAMARVAWEDHNTVRPGSWNAQDAAEEERLRRVLMQAECLFRGSRAHAEGCPNQVRP